MLTFDPYFISSMLAKLKGGATNVRIRRPDKGKSGPKTSNEIENTKKIKIPVMRKCQGSNELKD